MSPAASPTERRPVHAGTFYPSEPGALARLVDGLLGNVARQARPVPAHSVLGVLVPHAGLEYSGSVAAAGWALIATIRPTTIVLLGTDHAGRATGAAVWTDGAWSGPLGAVRVDRGLAERIVALGPPFRADNAVHEPEHSIEVQMPFITRACPGARVVPLLVGAARRDVAEIAGSWLGHLVADLRADGERVVLVASSDLAHYPPLDVAREIDRRVIEPILRLDGSELLRVETEIRASGEPGVSCGVCGLDAVRCMLAAVEEGGATHGSLLAEATSADRPGSDTDRTVGYAAIAFEY
jgi:AmmeMemoRadiSam system protein B